MNVYLVSLGAGLLVDIAYNLISVRSPAPPLVALAGLLGILVGEQIIPVSKQMLTDVAFLGAWREAKCTDVRPGPTAVSICRPATIRSSSRFRTET